MKKLTLTLFLSIIAVSLWAQTNKVVIETEYGKIVCMLYDNTPKNTENMVKLAKEHYYDSTLWHRVIPNFVIQGGDPKSKTAKAGEMLGEGELGYKVPAEINDTNIHKRGALGVARDNDPTKAGSACQFYIVVGKPYSESELDMMSRRTGKHYTDAQKKMYETIGGTPHLDGNYTVFGEVIEGMDVVDKIANAERDPHDRPKTDVHMITVRLEKKKKKFLFF